MNNIKTFYSKGKLENLFGIDLLCSNAVWFLEVGKVRLLSSQLIYELSPYGVKVSGKHCGVRCPETRSIKPGPCNS